MRILFSFLIFACSSLQVVADDLSASHIAAGFGKKTGSIDLRISGGFAPYTISWNGPGGFADTTEDIDSLAPGTYCVTVTDSYCGTAELCITVEEGPNAIPELAADAFSVGPNPFSNGIQLLPGSAVPGPMTVSLSDISGRQLLRQELETMPVSGYYLVTGAGLAPGVYMLQVHTANGGRWQQKVVREGRH